MDHKAAAEHRLKVADHLLSTTYPIVKDPRLLISVIENLYEAMDEAIKAVLSYESLLDTHVDANQRMEIFRRKIITKYSLHKNILDFTTDLKKILDNHKISSIEFSKKEKFIISDNDYNLKTLTSEEIKPKIIETKKYLHEMFSIIHNIE